MKQPVIILGAGGHARVLINMLRLARHEIKGILTLDSSLWGKSIEGIPVLGGDEILDHNPKHAIKLVNGIGSIPDPARRIRIFEHFKNEGFAFSTIVHPSAVLADDAIVSEGAQIMAGAVVQVGCRIGMNAIVNTGALVDHDCCLGDHVHLAPGVVLSGKVNIGCGTYVGTAAAFIEGICVGESAYVASGSVVVSNIPAGVRVMGVPARVC